MWDFFNSRRVKGRKAYLCEECRTLIPAGFVHTYCCGKCEGEMTSYRLCTACDLVISEGWRADVFDVEGYPMGEARAEIREVLGVEDVDAWAQEGAARRQAALEQRMAAAQAALTYQAHAGP